MDNILAPGETELIVQQLTPFNIKDIGTTKWLKQHEYLEKLNIQSHVCVSNQTDEFVMEALISYEKVPLLLHELIAVEMWRERVEPKLRDMDYVKDSSMLAYIVRYHEGTLMSLLESIMYHQEAVEACSDNILDLIDYCMRQITYLNSRTEEDVERELALADTPSADFAEMTGLKQLNYQLRDLPLQLGIKALSVLRYTTDHITHIPLSGMTRLLNTLDAPSNLASLLGVAPWHRRHNDREERFEDNEWKPVDPSDRMRLCKSEAQVWLALYNLLMEPECVKKYEYNTFNKNEVLKVRAHLTDVVIDQVPILAELRRYLEELSLMNPPAPSPSVVIEQVPELRDHFDKVNHGSWQAIAQYQLDHVFRPKDDKTLKTQAKILSDAYDLDMLEAMFPDDPKCVVCGADATNRCSRCHNEWYCRRQCQVEHWKKHKPTCDLIVSAKAAKKATEVS